MSRNLQLEFPFSIAADALIDWLRGVAAKAGARFELGPDGFSGTFTVRKVIITVAAGSFQIVKGEKGGGMVRLHVTQAAGFVTDEQIRTQFQSLVSQAETQGR